MDLTPITQWAGAIALLLSLGTTVYTLLTSGSKKTATDLQAHKATNSAVCAELENRIAAHAIRIQKLENEFGHLPDKDIVHRLELTMKDMQVQMAGMAASSEATARTARRVEEFLLDQAKAS